MVTNQWNVIEIDTEARVIFGPRMRTTMPALLAFRPSLKQMCSVDFFCVVQLFVCLR